MMLDELEALLGYVTDPDARSVEYFSAIVDNNCLGKTSGKSRRLSYRHLVELYGLDASMPLFQALLFFWRRESESHPLLAFLCAYCRDEVLRSGVPFVLRKSEGSVVNREMLEECLDEKYPDRYSRAMLRSTAQNINTSLTRAGYLSGRVQKIRTHPAPTPGTAAYALFLGHLHEVRGELLLQTEYAKLLDCPMDRLIELAELAARRGWMIFKRVGRVVEVGFPRLLDRGQCKLNE